MTTSSRIDNGSIKAKGDLVAILPVEAFTAPQGVTFRVRDRFESDVTFTWTAAQCTTDAKTGRTRCLSADKRFGADFKPVPQTPAAVRWALKMKRVGVLPPFEQTIAVTLSYGAGIDRVGRIEDCLSKTVSIVCKEF